MTLPDIAEADWTQFQADQFGQSVDNRIGALGFGTAADQQISSLDNVVPFGGSRPPEDRSSDVATLPDIPQDQHLAEQAGLASPPDTPTGPAAPTPPPVSPSPEPAPSPAVSPAQPASGPASSNQDQVVAALNAADAAGVDPEMFATVQQTANKPMPNLFDAANELKQHLEDAGGNLIDGLTSFLGNATSANKVLDRLAGIPEPAPAASPISTGGQLSPFDDTIKKYAGDLANDPEFLKIVTAGAKAESGLDPNKVQANGGGRGLFQFDVNGGMGTGLSPDKLFDPDYQASRIVPLYAQAYKNAPPNLKGADLAAWVAVQAERPDDRQGQASANYRANYNSLDQPQGAGSFVGGGGTSFNTQGAATSSPDRVAPDRAQPRNQDLSQFGDPQLTTDEAYAACGPAAAVRFAERFGRNPTLREATDLAKTVGWTSAQGMAGLDSEAALMQKMDVPVKVVRGAAWDTFAQEAQTGNPVTISTTGHYFTADGYNPDTGAFHVGRSGLDLKGGSEWMTPAQMTAVMGPVQGGLLANNPTVPAPSLAGGQGAQNDATAAVTPYGGSRPPQDRSVPDNASAPQPAGPASSLSPLDWLGQQKDALMAGFAPAASSILPPGGGGAGTPPDQGADQTAAAQPVAYGGSRPPEDRMAEQSVAGPPAPLPSVVAQRTTGQDIRDSGGQPAVAPAPSPAQPDQNPVQAFGQQIASGIIGLVQHLTGQQNPTGENPGAFSSPAPIPSSPDQLPFGGRTATDLLTEPLRGSNAAAPLSAQEIGSVLPSSPEQLPFGGRTAADVVTGTLSNLNEQGQQTEAAAMAAIGKIGRKEPLTAEDRQALSDYTLMVGGVSAPVEIAGDTLRPLASEAGNAVSRFFHGTGGDFPRPEPGKFDPNGLFGPGYYLTDRPEVASSYGMNAIGSATALQDELNGLYARKSAGLSDRQGFVVDSRIADLENQLQTLPATQGPNVRAVDVPQNLNLLNADAPIGADGLQQVADAVGKRFGADEGRNFALNARIQKGTDWTGETLFNSLRSYVRDIPGAGVSVDASPTVANSILADAGYDGIQYAGGQRIPMRDAAGAPIEHNALVVFPQSLDKLRNAVSGTQGGLALARFATTLGGAAAGGAAGYQAETATEPPDMTPQNQFIARAGATIGGAIAGGVAGHFAEPTIGYVRKLVAPAVDADPAVQSLLNTYDGQVRVAAAQADTLLRNGTLTKVGAEQYAKVAADTARQDFITATRGLQLSPDQQAITNQVVKNVTEGPGSFTKLVLQPLGKATGYLKETVLTSSPFHLVFEELQAGRMLGPDAPAPVGRSLLNAIDPTGKTYDAWRLRIAPIYEAAAQAGVTLPESRSMGEAVDKLTGLKGAAIRGAVGGAGSGIATYMTDKSSGASDQAALQDALGKGVLGAVTAGVVGSFMGPALWERAVPTLKVTGWQALTARGMAPEAAARMVNQTFGGLNLVRIARSPDVQAVARTIAFAPDVWEGMARQIGHTLNPDLTNPVSNAAKRYTATSAISGAFMLEGLNKLFSGHFTDQNDPGHELDLDVTRFAKATNDRGEPQRNYVDVLGLLRPVAEVGLGLSQGNFDPAGKFVSGRQGQLLRLGEAALTNQDYRGQPIVDPNSPPAARLAQLGRYALSQEIPASASGLAQAYERGGAGGAAIEGLTGMRVSGVSDRQAARAGGKANEPTIKALEDVGLSYPFTPGSVAVPGTRARLDLTKPEKDAYASDLFVNFRKEVGGVLSDPEYANMTPADRKAALQAATRAAERETLDGVLSAIPDAELDRRVEQRAAATPTPNRGRATTRVR